MLALGHCKTASDLHALAPSLGVTITPCSLIVINGNNVQAVIDEGTDDAVQLRLALREVKIKIAEFKRMKAAIVETKRRRRAEYTSYARQRGSMMKGGGGFGRFIRFITSISRDSKRAALDNDLAPLENAHVVAEATIHALQNLKVLIEARK